MFGICNLAIIPLRFEPNDRSEIVSQVLFGEDFEILEKQNNGLIKMHFDGYEGWIDSKQYQVISESNFNQLSDEPITLNSDLVEYVTGPSNLLIPIPLGAALSFINNNINTGGLEFEGSRVNGIKTKAPDKHSFLYLNAPYLWEWKHHLVLIVLALQMVYKLNGYKLLSASQQATQGFEFY
jgi:hypothetical protein